MWNQKGLLRYLFDREKGLCFWCGIECRMAEPGLERARGTIATKDHIILRSKGGKTRPKNLVLSCWNCNHTRGDMSAEEWLPIAMNRRSKKRVT